MVKTKTKGRTRRQLFERALGRSLAGLSVLAFQFRNEGEQQRAHYDLLTANPKPQYAMYDGCRTQAYVITQPEWEAQITSIVKAAGGQQFEPVLDRVENIAD
jgi:hypothetical protein